MKRFPVRTLFAADDLEQVAGMRRKIAEAYDRLPVVDQAAAPAYQQFVREIELQWKLLQQLGFKVVFVEHDPYHSSEEMFQDVWTHNRLFVFTGGNPHPLLGEANNYFRAIHDLFGHAWFGFQFGPDGEECAWRVHSIMFTFEARKAMTTETRGQSCWVNYFGDHQRLSPSERPYAIQKAAILPLEFVRL